MTKGVSVRVVVLVALCSALIGMLVTTSLSLSPAGNAGQFWIEGQRGTATQAAIPSLSGLSREVSRTVVNISTTKVISRRDLYREFFGPRDDSTDPYENFLRKYFDDNIPENDMRQKSLGSGFIISPDGYILTNNHVISEADEIIVALSDNEEYVAEVVGRDDKTDIALIKIDPVGQDLPVAVLGDSEDIDTGDWVIAIGNPFGLGHTLTQGIVSAKARIIGAGPYDNFIQTDAAINPGNSGGPLIDMQGQVVGINTAIVAAGHGIGFAVPINMVKGILAELRSAGEVTRGWLGVAIQGVTAEIARAVELPQARGAMVTLVYPGDPAERAGVLSGDILLKVNDQEIADPHGLTRLVGSLKPGSGVVVVVWRAGVELQLKATLKKREDEHRATLGKERPSPVEEHDRLGLTLTELTPEVARRLGLEGTRGVLVIEVDTAGPAAGGLKAGDVVIEVNRIAVAGVKHYLSLVGALKKGQTVLFLVLRQAAPLYVAIDIE